MTSKFRSDDLYVVYIKQTTLFLKMQDGKKSFTHYLAEATKFTEEEARKAARVQNDLEYDRLSGFQE